MRKWCIGAGCLLLSCAADGTKTGNGITMEFATTSEGLHLAEPDAGAADADAGLGLSDGLRTTDAAGSVFTITEAHMAVTEIELRQDGGINCAAVVDQSGLDCDEDRLRLRFDFDVDLLAGRTAPDLRDFELPAGIYQRVEVTIDDLEDDAAFADSTFFVNGEFSYEGDVVSFELSLARTETLRFEGSTGVLVEPGENLVARLDVSEWFRTLPITECVDSGELEIEDGHLVIADSGGCSELENAFVDALRASTALEQRR